MTVKNHYPNRNFFPVLSHLVHVIAGEHVDHAIQERGEGNDGVSMGEHCDKHDTAQQEAITAGKKQHRKPILLANPEH